MEEHNQTEKGVKVYYKMKITNKYDQWRPRFALSLNQVHSPEALNDSATRSHKNTLLFF